MAVFFMDLLRPPRHVAQSNYCYLQYVTCKTILHYFYHLKYLLYPVHSSVDLSQRKSHYKEFPVAVLYWKYFFKV